MIFVVLLYATLAAMFPLGKAALAHAGPIFFTSCRMLLGGCILLGYVLITEKKVCTVIASKRFLWPFVWLTLFNIYITNVFEFWGLQYLSAGKTCFIYNLSPFFAAFLSYFLFKERMTSIKWVGLIIGFSSFMPILLEHSGNENLSGYIGFLSWAEISLLIAAMATVYGWIVMRQLVLDSVSPLLANGLSMFVGGILMIPTSWFLEIWDPIPVQTWIPFFVYLIILTVLSNLIGYNVYGVLLKRYTATFLSFAGFMQPLFAALYGWMFLSEPITWQFVISAIGVLIGLYLFNNEELKQGYRKIS